MRMSSSVLTRVWRISVILTRTDFPEPVCPMMIPWGFISIFRLPKISCFVVLFRPYIYPPGSMMSWA